MIKTKHLNENIHDDYLLNDTIVEEIEQYLCSFTPWLDPCNQRIYVEVPMGKYHINLLQTAIEEMDYDFENYIKSYFDIINKVKQQLIFQRLFEINYENRTIEIGYWF